MSGVHQLKVPRTPSPANAGDVHRHPNEHYLKDTSDRLGEIVVTLRELVSELRDINKSTASTKKDGSGKAKRREGTDDDVVVEEEEEEVSLVAITNITNETYAAG